MRRAKSSHYQFDRLRLQRIRPHHDRKLARLDDEFHIDIPKCQPVGRDVERYGLSFARRERNALEAFQLFYGPGGGTYQVANVKLHYFVARAVAGVRDVDQHAGRFVAADRRSLQPRRTESELRVTQAKTEGEQRSHVVKQIPAAGRRLVIVKCRQVAGRPRNRDGQLAARVGVAE